MIAFRRIPRSFLAPILRHAAAGSTRDFSVEVKMPSLSPTMETGTIVKWNKKEGEEVSPGDVLCEVQTDKAVVSMEVDDEGVLAKILVPSDTPEIPVGSLIGMIAEPGEDWQEVRDTAKAAPPVQRQSETPPSTSATKEMSRPQPAPAAGVGSFSASERDVMQYISNNRLRPSDQKAELPQALVMPPYVPAAPGGAPISSVTEGIFPPRFPPTGRFAPTRFTDVPLSKEASEVGRRMVEVKRRVPHAYAVATVDLNRLSCLKSENAENSGVSDVLVNFAITALRTCPGLNVQRSGAPIGPDAPVTVMKYNVHSATYDSKLVTRTGTRPCDYSGTRFGSSSYFSILDLSDTDVTQCTVTIGESETAVLCIGSCRDDRVNISLCYDNSLVSQVDAAQYLHTLQSMGSDPDLALLGGPADLDYAADSDAIFDSMLKIL